MSTNSGIVRPPTITLIIPTHDPKRPLGKAIESFLAQKAPGDELLIGIDAHAETVETVRAIEKTILSFEAYLVIRYFIMDVGHKCWGHCVVNNLMLNAKGEFITLMDDDDFLTPDAFSKIREVIMKDGFRRDPCPHCGVPAPYYRQPFLFRTYSPTDNTHYWFKKDLIHGGLGGGCIVTPNMPERLGKYTCRYEGDADFVEATISKWGGKFEWCDDVIKHIRTAIDSVPPKGSPRQV